MNVMLFYFHFRRMQILSDNKDQMAPQSSIVKYKCLVVNLFGQFLIFTTSTVCVGQG